MSDADAREVIACALWEVEYQSQITECHAEVLEAYKANRADAILAALADAGYEVVRREWEDGGPVDDDD